MDEGKMSTAWMVFDSAVNETVLLIEYYLGCFTILTYTTWA